jgi:ADYC domain
MKALDVVTYVGMFGLAVAGCDAQEPFAGGDVTSRDCPTWQCGFNSAEVNGRAIRELNLDGVANSAGVKIVGFVAPLGLLGNYQLDVEGDELVAKKTGAATLRGLGLIGATILVKEPGLLSLPISITIAGYSGADSWSDAGADVPTYALVYPDLGSLTGTSNVCVGDLLDVLATSATVLGDETYDLTDKEVNAGMDRWFTIACAGSAAGKLRFMNYGPQSDFDGAGHAASVSARQAALKMVTADYCGTGVSYTTNGTPLQYEDAAGTVAVAGPFGDVEAIWTEDGAICLDATRVANTTVACSLPSCSGFDLEDGDWISYVP